MKERDRHSNFSELARTHITSILNDFIVLKNSTEDNNHHNLTIVAIDSDGRSFETVNKENNRSEIEAYNIHSFTQQQEQ